MAQSLGLPLLPCRCRPSLASRSSTTYVPQAQRPLPAPSHRYASGGEPQGHHAIVADGPPLCRWKSSSSCSHVRLRASRLPSPVLPSTSSGARPFIPKAPSAAPYARSWLQERLMRPPARRSAIAEKPLKRILLRWVHSLSGSHPLCPTSVFLCSWPMVDDEDKVEGKPDGGPMVLEIVPELSCCCYAF
jgi:hypothetical protein